MLVEIRFGVGDSEATDEAFEGTSHITELDLVNNRVIPAAMVTPSPHNPLGVKGVGETGAIGAPPAVVSAVCDALSPLVVTHLDMPLTPEKVWRAVSE